MSSFGKGIPSRSMKSTVLVAVGVYMMSIVSRVNAFVHPMSSSGTSISMDRSLSRGDALYVLPDANEWLASSSLLVSDKDYGELIKTGAIVLTLGGGLIPATISANSAMMKTLSGRKDAAPEADPSTIKPGESFDPTIFETKYRQYVEDSGAEGRWGNVFTRNDIFRSNFLFNLIYL